MTELRPLSPALIALLSALLLAPAQARAADPPPAAADAEAALPTARAAGLTFTIEGGSILLTDTAALRTFRLHPVAAAVFALADGKTPAAALARPAADLTGYEVDEATVFGALDALADAKLLLARVTPPGGSDLDLIVLTDGGLGTALVTPAPAAKEGSDVAKLRDRENQQKNLQLRPRQQEREVKKAAVEIRQASKARQEAVAALREARHSEAKKKHQSKEQDLAPVAEAQSRARAAAVVEASARRKLAQQEAQAKADR